MEGPIGCKIMVVTGDHSWLGLRSDPPFRESKSSQVCCNPRHHSLLSKAQSESLLFPLVPESIYTSNTCLGAISTILQHTYLFIYFNFFWQHHTACRILVLPPVMEHVTLAGRAPSPNHWTAREFPGNIIFKR